MTAESSLARFGSGKSVKRVEDDALLTGRGVFADDVAAPDQAHLHFLRSPHPHATIVAIDSAAAAAMPGVIAIVTGDDLVRAGVKPLVQSADFKRGDGSPTAAPPQHVLAVGTVRYVGEAVAAVVAQTREQARDAAEAIDVRYDPLPMVADLVDAVAPGAPLVWPAATGNIAAEKRHGDAAATAAAFANAAHVVKLDLFNQRLIPCPIEPRATSASFDVASGRITLRVSCQTPTGLRDELCNEVLGIPAGQSARAGRRRRRRLRHEDRALRGGRRRRVLHATVAAAAQVVRRPDGGIPVGDARPRSQQHGGARARYRRPDSRAAGHVVRESGRLCDARGGRHPADDRSRGWRPASTTSRPSMCGSPAC
jgi:xanthine dehydrogenase molybdopterin-binding subunit B